MKSGDYVTGFSFSTYGGLVVILVELLNDR